MEFKKILKQLNLLVIKEEVHEADRQEAKRQRYRKEKISLREKISPKINSNKEKYTKETIQMC